MMSTGDQDPVIQNDLLGLAEIARLAGVSRTVVSNWRARDKRFPRPITDLRSGPVFTSEQIHRYLLRKGQRMTHVISTINLKGGVGKTTTTVGIAEMLSGVHGRRVLVIDLDPQTNATTILLGEDNWNRLNEAGHTLATLFKDALRSEAEPARFDLGKTLQKNVSPVGEVRSVDLLPSSLDLIDVQDRLAMMPSGRFYSDNPTDLLRRAVRPILSDYDYVLIDCPPNLGIVTLNGLRISNGYIIPTIPDILSTYGIPQIQSRIDAFSENLGEDITEIGIIITKFRAASTVHINTIRQLEIGDHLPTVFQNRIPEANQIAASAEYVSYSTLRQKYGYQGQYVAMRDLAEEFMGKVEAQA